MDATAQIDKVIKEAAKKLGKEVTIEDISQIGIPDKKVLTYKFKDKKIEIIPIFDWHLGHSACNLEMIGAILKYILDKPYRYTVLGGDLAEMATKVSVGKGAYEQTMGAGQQIKWLYKLLKPLAEEGRILCGIIGNHEQRSINMLDFDPIEEICERLEVPHSQYQSYMLLDVGGHKHSVMVFHGSGGGRTKPGKVRSMLRMAEVAECDLYISGHTHTKTTEKIQRYVLDKDTGKLVSKTSHFVTSGSTLGYWNNYSEMKLLPPEELGVVSIELTDKIKINV